VIQKISQKKRFRSRFSALEILILFVPAFPFPTLPQSAREGWGTRSFLTATEFSSVELTTLILVDIFIRFREYILASLVSPFAGYFVSSNLRRA